MGKDNRAPSNAETAAEQLRHRILSHQLRGGDLVREEQLAERLGMSRTPVREAIARLVAEGLLTKDDNRTARVFQPSLTDLLEFYEIRMPLETLAAGLAADHVATAPKELKGQLAKQLTGLRATGSRDWVTRHESFHSTIFALSRRPRLHELLRGLRAQSEPYLRFYVHADPQFRRQFQIDHQELGAAVMDGDRPLTETLVRRHLGASMRKLEELLLLAEPYYP
jgi:DNA-binding GntR family transcriptional regulator